MAKCGKPCEIFSRVVGYFRPIENWNLGKKEEFRERKTFNIGGNRPAPVVVKTIAELKKLNRRQGNNG